MIDPDIEQLQDHPFVFMHGRDRFSFTEKQREDIRTWVDRGGFLFADSICSSQSFSDAFRKEMKLIFKDDPLKPVPHDHPLWSDPKFGTPLKEVTLREPDQNAIGGFRDTKTHPKMEGIEIDGQLQVLFFTVRLELRDGKHGRFSMPRIHPQRRHHHGGESFALLPQAWSARQLTQPNRFNRIAYRRSRLRPRHTSHPLR